ncbi:MAG TPA: aldehyde dehydrogenase family protein, partial [Jiangellales bacterium]|nr:aldehyde dehydrogenase family protein [Jiangellales bacterium]
MTTRTMIYIGGGWAAPASAGTIEVENPATEQVFGVVPAGTPEDVDAAVAAARAALDTWATAEPAVRAAALERLAAAVERRAG